MKFEHFLATHLAFTIDELIEFFQKEGHTTNSSTLHNLLAYHQKQGHILRIRRGLYYSIRGGVMQNAYPVDPYLVTSKMAKDSVLGYRTALDLHGKLHSVQNEFVYLTKKRVMAPFIFRDIKYQAASFPLALKASNSEGFALQTIDRLGQKILVTSLERTLVDVLDRPNLCGSWEEIWRSLESIEYLNVDQVVDYALLLGNATTIAKLGFFLEIHREEWMIPERYFETLYKHRPVKPHYLDRGRNQQQKMIAKWNLIVPADLFNRSWEEPNADF